MMTCRFVCVASICVVAGLACGDDGVLYPYQDDTTVVIGPEGAQSMATPDGDVCIDPAAAECVKPQSQCGEGATADVLLDSEGKLIEVVCYPEAGAMEAATPMNGQLVFGDNNVVAVFGDGELDGGVTVQGNNGVIYGASPDATKIDGDVTLQGNNSIVRGVWVTGNVEFQGNDVKLFHCVIEGNVLIKGNNGLLSNCVVFGSIVYEGNNAEIISNLVQGGVTFSGEGQTCRDNRFFLDSNDNTKLDSDERAAAESLVCG